MGLVFFLEYFFPYTHLPPSSDYLIIGEFLGIYHAGIITLRNLSFLSCATLIYAVYYTQYTRTHT